MVAELGRKPEKAEAQDQMGGGGAMAAPVALPEGMDQNGRKGKEKEKASRCVNTPDVPRADMVVMLNDAEDTGSSGEGEQPAEEQSAGVGMDTEREHRGISDGRGTGVI